MSPSLAPLRAHPVCALADLLAEYVGVERDLVQFVELLSLAAGRMVTPVNLDIQTDNLTVDLHLANRILDLRHEHVARIDTHKEFRALERAEFYLHGKATNDYSDDPPDRPRPVAAVLVRGNHRLLHREVSEYTARLLGGDFTLPSLWRVTDLASSLPPVPSTLRVQTNQTGRGLDDFGHAFAGYRCCPEENELARLIESLPIQPVYPCAFRDRLRGVLRPEMMLAFRRLLHVLVAYRVVLPGSTDKRPEVLPEDYEAARALVVCLPLTPVDRDVSPQALGTASLIHEAIQDDGEQLSLPDLSQYGNKWFTRLDTVRWTGLGYNTVKKHLRELEGEGILRSTVAENNRERGRQIHFRFGDGRTPPFEWKNPFEGLPELAAPPPGT